jgi:hypothetical protein
MDLSQSRGDGIFAVLDPTADRKPDGRSGGPLIPPQKQQPIQLVKQQ